MAADKQYEWKSDAISIVAIIVVISVVFVGLAEDLNRTEVGTLIAVTVCLFIFECGRYTDRHNRRKTEPRQTLGWFSVGRVRVLVALFAVTVMMVLYSARFDGDEWLRIGVLATMFGLYEGLRVFRHRWLELTVEQRKGIGNNLSLLRSGFLEALGKAIGTGVGAGLVGSIGWLAKPWIMRLVQ